MRRTAVLFISALLAVSVLTVVPATSALAAGCGTLTQPVYLRVNPNTAAGLLTRSMAEATNAANRYGYTQDEGVAFRAAAGAGDGLVGVHRLYSASTRDFVSLVDTNEIKATVAEGYVDQGVRFWASAVSTDCAIPVSRLVRGGMHRQVATDAARSELLAAGWTDDGVAFYAGTADDTTTPPTPPITDPTFTIAVIPDTQQEVLNPADTRFAARNRWLVDNRQSLNLAFVAHTGDLVNWDTPDHAQYVRGSAAMKVLDDAGVPWAGAVGNHDTGAVCPGGSACPDKKVRVAVRDTSTYNAYFPVSRFTAMNDEFEPGRVDNAWSTFEVAGTKWMVVTLELWPRKEAVAWAAAAVAANRDRNVLVVTHSYLDADGSIYQGADYGVSTPQYLFDTLIEPHSNVKLVVSGHVGDSADREDVRPDGTKVASFLGAWHSNATNPVQLLEINTAAGTVHRSWKAPATSADFRELDTTITGMSWVR